jgi:hypothetical protein
MSVNKMTNPTLEVKNPTPFDLPQEQFLEALQRRSTNRNELLTWIRANLTEGVDFGRIHFTSKSKCAMGKECKIATHWTKPILFKAGSEKVCGLLGVTVQLVKLDSPEVLVRCDLLDASERILAVGLGARTLAQDNGDLNKAFKMAAKSAQIDATLRLAGLSEIFTQDLEDNPPPAEEGYAVNSQQLKRLRARIQGYDLPEERVLKYAKARYGVETLEQMSFEQYQELDAKLEEFADVVRKERETQPIGKEELKKIVSYALQHKVDLHDIFAKVGLKKMADLTYGLLDQFWNAMESTVESRAKAEYEALSEAERLARSLAIEKAMVEADRKAGRMPTYGT